MGLIKHLRVVKEEAEKTGIKIKYDEILRIQAAIDEVNEKKNKKEHKSQSVSRAGGSRSKTPMGKTQKITTPAPEEEDHDENDSQ